MSSTDERHDDVTESAGPSTDQHVTGSPETGESIVDRPPTGSTPSHGSGNKGVNTTRANRSTD